MDVWASISESSVSLNSRRSSSSDNGALAFLSPMAMVRHYCFCVLNSPWDSSIFQSYSSLVLSRLVYCSYWGIALDKTVELRTNAFLRVPYWDNLSFPSINRSDRRDRAVDIFVNGVEHL